MIRDLHGARIQFGPGAQVSARMAERLTGPGGVSGHLNNNGLDEREVDRLLVLGEPVHLFRPRMILAGMCSCAASVFAADFLRGEVDPTIQSRPNIGRPATMEEGSPAD
ncbi:hypothetical protein TV39_08875 [Arthrobacter sp. SPG23]|nr:hypothetical protein TV39_08875 [Arthrobacter sp. SPG23]